MSDPTAHPPDAIPQLPPPPYSETDIYSRSARSIPARSAAAPSSTGSSDNNINTPKYTTASRVDTASTTSSNDADPVLTPTHSPTSETHPHAHVRFGDRFPPARAPDYEEEEYVDADYEHDVGTAAAWAYFSSRPVSEELENRSGLLDPLTHTIILSRETRPASLPFPDPAEVWVERDVLPVDWTTFVNFLVPWWGEVSNRHRLGTGDVKREEGMDDGDEQSEGLGKMDIENAKRVVDLWNEGFFAARGVRIDVHAIESGETERVAAAETSEREMPVPGEWTEEAGGNEYENVGEREAEGLPGSGRRGWWGGERGRFRGRGAGRGMGGGRGGGWGGGWGGWRGGGGGGGWGRGGLPWMRAGSDGFHMGDFMSADNNDFRMFGNRFVADNNGLRFGGNRQNDDDVENSHRGRGGRGRRASSDLNENHHDHHSHHDNHGRHHRSHSMSSDSSSSSSSSDDSVGSLPDYDRLSDAQLPVAKHYVQTWLEHPEQPITRAAVQAIIKEIKAAKVNASSIAKSPSIEIGNVSNSPGDVKDPWNPTPTSDTEVPDNQAAKEQLRAELKALLKEFKRLVKAQKQTKREERRRKRDARRERKRERKERRREAKRERKGKGRERPCGSSGSASAAAPASPYPVPMGGPPFSYPQAMNLPFRNVALPFQSGTFPFQPPPAPPVPQAKQASPPPPPPPGTAANPQAPPPPSPPSFTPASPPPPPTPPTLSDLPAYVRNQVYNAGLQAQRDVQRGMREAVEARIVAQREAQEAFREVVQVQRERERERMRVRRDSELARREVERARKEVKREV